MLIICVTNELSNSYDQLKVEYLTSTNDIYDDHMCDR